MRRRRESKTSNNNSRNHVLSFLPHLITRISMSMPIVLAPWCAAGTSSPPVPTNGSNTSDDLRTPARLHIKNASSVSMVVGPRYRRRLRSYLFSIVPRFVPIPTCRPKKIQLRRYATGNSNGHDATIQ